MQIIKIASIILLIIGYRFKNLLAIKMEKMTYEGNLIEVRSDKKT
jgi:hypothetical protein